MVFNTETGQGRMVGGASGPNKGNRPRAVFYPKQSNTNSSNSRR